MPSRIKSTEIIIKKIPINLSMAVRALLPSFLPSASDETNMIPEMRLATNTAIDHSVHLLGSWAINKITAAIAEGPAIIGIARGTTKGSDSSS